MCVLGLGKLGVLGLGELSILWAHPWLLSLHIAIPIFLVLFLILANGAMWSPQKFFQSLLRSHHHIGDHCYLGWCFCFDGGAGVGAGVEGIGQSFLALNRFSGADTELDLGVPCLTGALGMSSTAGELE